MLKGHRLLFPNKIVFLFLKIIFALANSVEPDEKPHLGLQCLQKYAIKGDTRIKREL